MQDIRKYLRWLLLRAVVREWRTEAAPAAGT